VEYTSRKDTACGGRLFNPTRRALFRCNPALPRYDLGVSRKLSSNLSIDTTLLKPGMRLAVGLSGGADSVALLCALAERSRELGLSLIHI